MTKRCLYSNEYLLNISGSDVITTDTSIVPMSVVYANQAIVQDYWSCQHDDTGPAPAHVITLSTVCQDCALCFCEYVVYVVVYRRVSAPDPGCHCVH